MEKGTTFTEEKILKPLILFALPVLFALQILLCVGFMLYLKKKAKV